MNEAVLFDVADGIATITLNRPEAMNAMSRDLSEGLAEAVREVRDNDAVRVAILTGNGRAFCAGADLRERSATGRGFNNPSDVFGTTGGGGFGAADTKKPIIAAINGYCLGGGFEMSLQCDLRIASELASFGLPEITHGFFPGGGGPVRLPRFIPQALAAEIVLLGERFDAATALRYGVISRVVPPDQLMPTAHAMAERIAGFAPIAVRAVTELMRSQGDLPLDRALRLGSSLRWIVGQTEDAREGPRAFAEKRKPQFKGQ